MGQVVEEALRTQLLDQLVAVGVLQFRQHLHDAFEAVAGEENRLSSVTCALMLARFGILVARPGELVGCQSVMRRGRQLRTTKSASSLKNSPSEIRQGQSWSSNI